MQVMVGQTVKGKVTKITNFGAFVSLETGGNALVHISEISSEYVKNISDYLSEGQEVQAIVLSAEGNKITLSIKKLEEKRKNSGQPIEFKPADRTSQSFEDMMHRFKSESDEKFSDLKRMESRRGVSRKNGK